MKNTLSIFILLLGLLYPFRGTASDNLYKGQLAPRDSTWQYSEFLTQPMPDADSWWTLFEDPTLQRVIALALDNNYQIKSALQRLETSRIQMKAVYSDYYPSFDLSLGYVKDRSSGREMKPYGKASNTSYFQAGISASWEIDIFGRVYASARAAKEEVNLSRIEYDAVMVSIAANAASEYFTYRMYRQQLATTNDHVRSQQELLDIVNARYKAGLVSKLDVAQGETMMYTIQATIPDIESSIATTLNALATLCAVSPSELAKLLNSTDTGLPKAPKVGPIGLPAEMLRRRPDVVEAEIQLARLAAQVGIAKKDFLPTLSIDAQFGFSSHNLNGLFTRDGLGFSVAPTLSWTIFDGLSRKYAVQEARSQLEASVDDYNNTMLNAYAEVNNAMASILSARKKCELLKKVENQSAETLSLALDRYKLGITGFSDVADAQEDLLTSQDNLVAADGVLLQSIITLYEALGGGWSPN